MIFVTVGSLQSFDRLVSAVDQWAAEHRPDEEILAQVGETTFKPTAISTVSTLSPSAYRETFERSRLVVAHAGMGTIITALEVGKPTIVMPRRGHLNETRNDHQMATVKHFQRATWIQVAEDETALKTLLDQSMNETETQAPETEPWPPDPKLISAVKQFLMSSK